MLDKSVMKPGLKFLTLSLTIHAVVIVLFSWCLRIEKNPAVENRKFLVQVEGFGKKVATTAPEGSRSSESRRTQTRRRYDLRPSFTKNGVFMPKAIEVVTNSEGAVANNFGITNGFSKELLFTEGKVLQIFDVLATRINNHLDYPGILMEQGVQGIATLELFFDDKGEVDESKSKCFGDNRLVRGLLVKAVRYGLAEWFINEAQRLEKEKFRNQHFRADFEISHLLGSSSELTKSVTGAYQFKRRRFAHTCVSPIGIGGAGLDVVCVAAKVTGFLSSRLSGKYKSRFYALVDSLEHFDGIGLIGLNSRIRNRI